MKVKNISVGDFVQVKKRLVSNMFKAKQVCEVIRIDSEHKFRPDVLIKGEYCLEWVNHKDLKKPIQRKPEPQLKQLDQSIFNGLDEKWQFAAVDKGGAVWVYSGKPDRDCGYWFVKEPVGMSIGRGYDASNWQNSLIERDIAKEPAEVDLSSELTGSDLAVKYFESNERHICFVGEDNDGCLSDLMIAMVVGYNEYRGFMTSYNDWFPFVTLINNQGEPLTAAEAGL